MALKRTDIRAIFSDVEGVTDSHIKKILDALHDEIDTVKDENDDLKKQIENAGKDNWKSKHDRLKQEFDDYKKNQEAKEALAEKRNAFAEILKDSGLSEAGQKKALKYTNLEELEYENGKFAKVSEILKNVKEEWSDYVTSEEKKGKDTDDKDGAKGTDGNKKMTKEEIMKIKDASERQKAILENHELFS